MRNPASQALPELWRLLLPLAHQDQPGHPQVPASLRDILRRLLAPARTVAGEDPDPAGQRT